MPHAQVLRFPVASGEGRLRHKAAVACRANWAYSSSRCARQKASVSATMASKVACIGLGTRSDLLMLAIVLSQFLQGEHLPPTLLRKPRGWTPVRAEVWCCDRLRVWGELVSDARWKER